jgi:hypothetical protein
MSVGDTKVGSVAGDAVAGDAVAGPAPAPVAPVAPAAKTERLDLTSITVFNKTKNVTRTFSVGETLNFMDTYKRITKGNRKVAGRSELTIREFHIIPRTQVVMAYGRNEQGGVVTQTLGKVA